MKHIVVLLLLATPVSAQQRKLTIDAFDAAWAGAIAGDKLSTDHWKRTCPTCHEGSPIGNSGARIGMQFGMLGAVKLLEYHNPNHKWTFRIFKGAMIGLEVFVISHNMRLK